MNETEFQALFDSYQQALRSQEKHPVPQKLHLMVYHYAQRRHQQSSDVSADFYLHIVGKIQGILDRYDPRKTPFYQYMASYLNFEFTHFLRRRRLSRSQIELLSLEDLAQRHVELQAPRPPDGDLGSELLSLLKPGQRIYAKLSLAFPLCFGELRALATRQKGKSKGNGWSTLRAYREYLQFTETKRQQFLRERDHLLLTLMRSQAADGKAAEKRRESARKKFFSMDTRIPIRIVAAVTGEPIASVQRHMKAAIRSLKDAYTRREKQNLVANRGKRKEAD
ncbi:MAG: hypothetical protein U1F27_06840 [Turneriella sp.]